MSRQIHNPKPNSPLAIAVDALIRLQVQTAVLTEIAERLRNQELFNLSVQMYDAAEKAIHDAKGRH